ncbi:hypothetical protein [Nocardioides euryhalodurans]|uniref:Uncharacterized protein n=1 Tax=Nocardioides euryhalodurans TaxID=2518370 RepID=A0A4P7GHZ1_9ACTN|nr:hypothetical protein [Nocardioides euryhalodurans]QBR91548.1 hypothetical protein EXE57_04120 [Nocardioides euryhalodurans]
MEPADECSFARSSTARTGPPRVLVGVLSGAWRIGEPTGDAAFAIERHPATLTRRPDRRTAVVSRFEVRRPGLRERRCGGRLQRVLVVHRVPLVRPERGERAHDAVDRGVDVAPHDRCHVVPLVRGHHDQDATVRVDVVGDHHLDLPGADLVGRRPRVERLDEALPQPLVVHVSSRPESIRTAS